MANRHSAPNAKALREPGISDALPDYIVERNRLATAAGLTIAKQVIRDDKLTTWYVGSEAQWRAGPFQHTRKKPFPQKVGAIVSSGFRCFSPISVYWGKVGFGVVAVGHDSYRGTVTEPLPESADDLGDGIAVYGTPDALYYVGNLATMVARKIVPDEPAPDPDHTESTWYWVDDGCGTVTSLGDGRAIYCDLIAKREREAQEKAEARKRDYKTTGAMLSHWGNTTSRLLTSIVAEFREAETVDGRIFAVTGESLTTIATLADELLEAIRCAQVSVRHARPETASRAASAKADPAFRAFLSQAGIEAD